MTTLNQPSRFPTDRGKSAVALVASGALDNPIFVGTEHRLVPQHLERGSLLRHVTRQLHLPRCDVPPDQGVQASHRPQTPVCARSG